MNGIFTMLLHEMEKNCDTVLCTIIADSGSTPRGRGAQMLVGADGLLCGTIGGGAVEGGAVALGKTLLHERRSAVHRLDGQEIENAYPRAQRREIQGGGIFFRKRQSRERKQEVCRGSRQGTERFTAVIEARLSPVYPHAEHTEDYRIGRRGAERKEQNMRRLMHGAAQEHGRCSFAAVEHKYNGCCHGKGKAELNAGIFYSETHQALPSKSRRAGSYLSPFIRTSK